MIKLFPREESFLPQFARAAEIILEAANALDELAADFTDVELKVARIKHLEHEGDQVAHQTFGLLSRTWITPIDREDIHDLVKALDDVLDYLDAAAARLVLYKIPAPTPALKSATAILVQSAEAICRAAGLLGDLKNSAAILEICVEINRLENEADTPEPHLHRKPLRDGEGSDRAHEMEGDLRGSRRGHGPLRGRRERFRADRPEVLLSLAPRR